MTEDPRISEIRAALDAYSGPTSPVELPEDEFGRNILDCIRAILDRTAPAPRVFFPGDHIPSDLVVVTEHGVVYAYDAPETTWDEIGGPVVDMPVPTTEEWQAAVDRARAERPEVQS